MNLSLFRYAFVLILLALIGGFFVQIMAVPRLGLSAHTIGVYSGVLLIAVGAIWQNFHLSLRQASLLKWCWIYSGYANWLCTIVGGVFGAGKMTPIASAGFVGSPLIENVVAGLLISEAFASLAAVGLSLWGLRANAITDMASIIDVTEIK